MSRRLQFDEPQGLVEVLVRKACSPCAANLMLRAYAKFSGREGL
jgi:hypothetical protein